MKQTTLYLDDETLSRVNAEKGLLNRKLLELIKIGLDTLEGQGEAQVITDLVSVTKRFMKLVKEKRIKIVEPTQGD